MNFFLPHLRQRRPTQTAHRWGEWGAGAYERSGDELLLLIEVADTSVSFDRRVKSALYARASVPEYWVLDVSSRGLYVHRHPVGGNYRQVTRLAEDETVAPDSRPDAAVKVSELLPPAPAA